MKLQKGQNPLHLFPRNFPVDREVANTSRCNGIWETTRHNRHNVLLPAPTCYRLFMLRTCYGKTWVMGFGLNRAAETRQWFQGCVKLLSAAGLTSLLFNLTKSQRLWADKPSRYVTSHLGQLSLPSLWGR